MPIRLNPPNDFYAASGPDGQGRNRLRIEIMEPQSRCALRPRTYGALWEAQDTRRVRWSSLFSTCDGPGECSTCPRLEARYELKRQDASIMVRLKDEEPDWVFVMADPSAGWASESTPVLWDQIAMLEGWELGRQGRDEHGTFFWFNSL